MSETIAMRELPLTEAAAVLRSTPEAVRMRWRRGKLKGRRDDAGRILIQVDSNEAEQPTGRDRTTPGQGEIVEVLKAQVVDLQKRLDAADQGQAEMRRLLLQSQSQVSDLTHRLAALPAPAENPINETEATEPQVVEPAGQAKRARWSLWSLLSPWS